MTYNVSSPTIAISGAVHRELNDVVSRMTDRNVSGWENNYQIFIGLDGRISAVATEINQYSPKGFKTSIKDKLVFLPTPAWVKSEQRLYICFNYEVADLMKKWWGNFTDFLR